MNTLIGTRSELGEATYADMLRLRHKVFHSRLKWDMPNTAKEEEMEQDEFDTDETIYIVIGNPAVACCRLIPTHKITMISKLWPDVLPDMSKHESDWELSRFAADRDAKMPGFLAAKILYEAYKYAIQSKIKNYIVISTPPVIKVINKMGIKTEHLPSNDSSIVASKTSITDEVGELLASLVSTMAPQPELKTVRRMR